MKQKVQGKVLDEVVNVVLQAPAVEGLEYRESCALPYVYSSLGRCTLAEPQGLTSERPLEKLALIVTRERTALSFIV